MLRTLGSRVLVGRKRRKASFVYRDAGNLPGALTVWDYGSKSIGPENKGRWVIAIFCARASYDPSARATMNGVGMTLVHANKDMVYGHNFYVFAKWVPSGLTANFVFYGSIGDAGVMVVGTISDLRRPIVRDFASMANNTNSGNFLNDLAVMEGGVLLGVSFCVSGTPVSGSWTVLTHLYNAWGNNALLSVAALDYPLAANGINVIAYCGNGGGAAEATSVISLR